MQLLSLQSAVANLSDIPDRSIDHYPSNSPSFGQKRAVLLSFRLAGSSICTFYIMMRLYKDVFCHTCLMRFKLKRVRTNSADAAFVSFLASSVLLLSHTAK